MLIIKCKTVELTYAKQTVLQEELKSDSPTRGAEIRQYYKRSCNQTVLQEELKSDSATRGACNQTVLGEEL